MFKGATVVIPPERMPIDSDVVRKAIGTRPIVSLEPLICRRGNLMVPIAPGN
jgi:hypothetical protein